MGSQQFCLKWNNHHSNMLNVFEHLLSSEALVDVTLACEGLSLKAHKMVLSACSPFFQSLFLENPCKHPIVILKDMRYADLKAIIDFMYRGEVNVSQNQLSALLKTAETLKVKGLAEVSGEDGQSNGSGVVQQEVVQQTVPQATVVPGGAGSASQTTTTPSGSTRADTPPLSRRKRGRPRRRSLSDSNRSDSEDQVPAKIREAESPEVIEDRDMDTSSSTVGGAAEGTNGVQKLPLPLQTQTHTQSQQESRLTIDEVTSGDEGDFVEPSKLMEQSMTTENVPVFPDGQSSGSTLSPVPSQRLVLGSSSLVERSLQGPSTSDSQALVPVSLSSEISVAGHSSQDIPEDIKPTGLVSYDEPSLSPVAGPSHHSQDGSAMMMYMDSSGVPAIPGPSNYQPDNKSSSQPQPSQGFSFPMAMNVFPMNAVFDIFGFGGSFFASSSGLSQFKRSWGSSRSNKSKVVSRTVQPIAPVEIEEAEPSEAIGGHIPVPCTRRRCIVCSAKKMQRRSLIQCQKCQVALCRDRFKNCFDEYHKMSNKL